MSDKRPIPVKTALISVFNKSGLPSLYPAFQTFNVVCYSTGGTANFLEKEKSLTVQRIEKLTEFPEMMEGRVKTLHPKVFGGILARRDHRNDIQEAQRLHIPLFDLVIVNLYPFADHIGKDWSEQVAFIDIGGPSMIRAAAKSFASVTALSDPSDYPEFLQELETHNGHTTLDFRKNMAIKTFERTFAYDSMIANEWGKATELPKTLSLYPQTPLRYGENPHQKAVWAGSSSWRCLQGKELSYNNLLDADGAVKIAFDFQDACVSIVKHNNPCGVASQKDEVIGVLFERALSTDPKSAFGGIVATNREVDEAAAVAMSKMFLEVIVAPGFTEAAKKILAGKKNLRLITWQKPHFPPFEVRPAMGGWLLQEPDSQLLENHLQAVTRRSVPENLWEDLKFAWIVCKHVKSNSIVIAKNGVTLGVGAGQMSRVDSVNIALEKSKMFDRKGAVLASDAFFPFRDNIDLLKETGVEAVIQPGGSQRDSEVIAACDELGIAMVFTGERHFRH